jgi:hypothetical protein
MVCHPGQHESALYHDDDIALCPFLLLLLVRRLPSFLSCLLSMFPIKVEKEGYTHEEPSPTGTGCSSQKGL